MREAREILRDAFEEACDAVGARRDGRALVLDDLLGRLSEPHRRYHDATHVAACLELAHAHRGHARRPAEVSLALLFHDAVYTRAPGDERASAALATAALGRLGVRPEVLERVERLVLATESHEPHGDPDAELVLDADLSILGVDEPRFDVFERAIREEYAHVPAVAFRSGRIAVLRRFLERPALFHVPALRAELEHAARANLRRAIVRLEGLGG